MRSSFGPSGPRKSFARGLQFSALALVAAVLLGWAAVSLTHKGSSNDIGAAALDHVRALVEFGPRPSGSAEHRQMQQYILGNLESVGIQTEQDSFEAATPIGTVPMTNLIARLGNRGGQVVVLATHYETKRETEFRFVGANDGGSGTGLLLALAPLLADREFSFDVWLVFFDGEEAFEEWGEADSLYGSRHLAAKWKADGTLPRIGALILLDMIGDADLGIVRDSNSTPWLRDQVWRVAQRLGYSRHFLSQEMGIEDDHLPFIREGVPSLDLIDFSYGPGNRYWHSPEDTLDKLSARSLQVVAEVVLETLSELSARP